MRKLPDHWSHLGRMDHWLGEIVTIKEYYGNHNGIPAYKIEEDQDEVPFGWIWREDCLELISSAGAPFKYSVN